MSVPGSRPNAEQASVRVVRGLLERNLLERAVALAETRWPGSGPLVRLAHEWASLSPGDRRQRLAAIGPDELARMRALAEIQPDLARVLDDLETRGILPPVIDQRREVQSSQQRSVQAPETPSVPTIPEQAADPPPSTTPADSARQPLVPLPQVSRPTLDLGLPTTTQFLESEVERRAHMVEQAESILERIRAKINETSDQLVERRPVEREERTRDDETDLTSRRLPPPLRIRSRAVEPTSGSAESATAHSVATMAERSPSLTERLRSSAVLELDTGELLPSNDAIRATAGELGLPVVELSTDELGAREFWGGLTRQGREVIPRAGLLPRAVSGHNLVVVRGRLTPRAVARLRDGFCDIPGTKATVKVNERARILLLPA